MASKGFGEQKPGTAVETKNTLSQNTSYIGDKHSGCENLRGVLIVDKRSHQDQQKDMTHRQKKGRDTYSHLLGKEGPLFSLHPERRRALHNTFPQHPGLPSPLLTPAFLTYLPIFNVPQDKMKIPTERKKGSKSLGLFYSCIISMNSLCLCPLSRIHHHKPERR